MKHFLLHFILMIFYLCSAPVCAQFAENIQVIGGSYNDHVVKITHDKEDNRYVIGFIGPPDGSDDFSQYKGEIDFGTFKKEITRSFIAKFDKDNRCVWVKQGPKNMWDSYSDLVVDNAGFVYVTGYIQKTNFVLEKLDPHENLVWEKKYKPKNSWLNFKGEKIAVDKQGSVYVAGSFDGADIEKFTFNFHSTGNGPYTDFLVKFNADGQPLWVKTSLEANTRYTDVLVDAMGDVITAGRFQNKINVDGYIIENSNPPNEELFLVKRDPDGKVKWVKNYPLWTGSNVVLDADNNIYFSGSANFGSAGFVVIDDVRLDESLRSILIKIDHLGKAKWATNFPSTTFYYSLIFANKSLYISGAYYVSFKIKDEVLKANSNSESDIFLVNFNLKGEKQWMRRYGGDKSEFSPTLAFLPKKKEIVIAGRFNEQLPNNNRILVSKGSSDIFIGQIPDTLAEAETMIARISGRIYRDSNANCSLDTAEAGVAHKLLKIEPGDQYAMTNEQGIYSARVPYGKFTLTPLFSAISKAQTIISCQESISVSTDSLHQRATDVNFGLHITDCSQLTIDIAADRRRRCMRSKTTVTYSNDGMGDAQHVRIKVLYPRYVVPIKSSLAWTSRQDSVMVFDIGTLKAGERRSFVITDSTICGNEAIRGLSQCVKALISPKSTCISPSSEWDQSSVVVEARLTEEDQVASFTIANQGQGDMSDSTAYRLYANEALVEQGKVKLASGAKARLAVPDPRATLRLEADQSPNHPGMSRPVASIQPAMVSPALAAPSPIDASYQDDADAEVSISCLPIIDSFDPNDKQVSPQGISRRHYIKAEDELEYQIRFQNTGTDTAYTVVVKDTLSPHVDVASLRIGSASHPFTYTVSGKGRPVLTFTFKNINLPDHKRNEPASHGYIKFRIAQNPGNPRGTVIRNLAYNYFDFNSPIATNEVFNIIGDTIMAPLVPLMVYDCGKQLPTAALAGEEIRLCETAETVLQANAPQQGTGRWHILSGQASLSDPASPQSRLTGIGYGEVVLEWRISLCEVVSRSQVKVLRYRIPAAPVITVPALQCEGSQLLPLRASGSNITWYADAEKKQKLYSGNDFIPQLQATTTFYASQTVDGCESPVAAVEVKMHPASLSFGVNQDTLVAPPADSYQWYFNGQPLEGATGQKLFPRNTGSYSLQATTQGCVSTSEAMAIAKNHPQALLSLGPNPASGRLHLELTANETGQVRMVIWDRLGREVRSFQAFKPHTVLEQTLELGNISAGLYLLEIQVGPQILTRKFVQK